jgi:hypothetical protein
MFSFLVKGLNSKTSATTPNFFFFIVAFKHVIGVKCFKPRVSIAIDVYLVDDNWWKLRKEYENHRKV